MCYENIKIGLYRFKNQVSGHVRTEATEVVPVKPAPWTGLSDEIRKGEGKA